MGPLIKCRRCGAVLSADGACPACALGKLLDPSDDLIGLIPESWPLPEELRFVDEYLLLEPLGAGGMGDVFRARSVHSHQFVAVKLLKPSVHPGRSDLEIRSLAEISHPGIVRFLRRGRLGDRNGSRWS